MPADQMVRGQLHLTFHERLRHMPGAVQLERQWRTAVDDAIDIMARCGAVAGMEIVSGAGHDAVYVARVAPTAMIFVPCKDGISHNEIEDAQPADLAAGCNVLLHAALGKAGIADSRRAA